MLNDISVSIMVPEELTVFSDRVTAVTGPPFDVILGKRITSITLGSRNLTNAINRDKKSPFTPVLAKWDNRRDNSFRSYNFAVLSAVFNNTPEISKAGKKIQEVIIRHDPSLYRLGYVAQSAKMKSLTQELDELTADMESANVMEQYTAMKDDMAAFNEVLKQKDEAESGMKVPGKEESKKELSRQIILLMRQVQILIEDQEDGIESLVEKYNEVISSTMAQVRARITREENNSDDAEDASNDSIT